MKPKKYMLVMFEITDDEPVEDLKASVPEAAYVGGTEGLTLVQVGTGEEVFLPYACWFDKQSSRSWNGPQFAEYNWLFLRQQQNWCNDMLQSRGYLSLNDVYDVLGLPRSGVGAAVGWVYDRENEGDNFVDFGCWDQQQNETERFEVPDREDREGAILLDFNVQGPVLAAYK